MRSTLFVASLLLASAAQAADPRPAADPAPPARTADADKLICHREVNSGSNIPGKRICKTKRDIDMEQRAARDRATEFVTPTGGSSGN